MNYDYIARTGKALSHPLRCRILGCLDEKRTRTLNGNSLSDLDPKAFGMSPSEIARLLDEPVSNTSYHFRLLKELGAITVVNLRPARGALEHFYALTRFGADAALAATKMSDGDD